MTRFRRHRGRGFTLMEMLVVLVIAAMLMSMLFQSLGIFRRAQASLDANTVRARQQALAARWYADTVTGLFPIEREPFTGDDTHWQGVTLQPLQGSPGAPTTVQWTVAVDTPRPSLRYVSEGNPPIDLDLPAGNWRFRYFDQSGKSYEQWPPALGLASNLPDGIALVDEDSKSVSWFAAVIGPLRPAPVPFEAEQE